jgi:hypothetical protein
MEKITVEIQHNIVLQYFKTEDKSISMQSAARCCCVVCLLSNLSNPEGGDNTFHQNTGNIPEDSFLQSPS